jgi:nitric oxide reductase subunit B
LPGLRWLRVFGDTLFALGVVALGVFVVGLKTGWCVKGTKDVIVEQRDAGSPQTAL